MHYTWGGVGTKAAQHMTLNLLLYSQYGFAKDNNCVSERAAVRSVNFTGARGLNHRQPSR